MEREALLRKINDHLGILFTLFFVFVVVVALALDFDFLRGFVLMILQIAVVSALGCVIGVALAEVVLRSEWMTQSTIRFLRLGLWLPFFAVWATRAWWIPWNNFLQVSPGVKEILAVVIPALPTVTFAVCYYYLSARQPLRLHRRRAFLMIVRPTLLHSLFFALFAQTLLYSDGWQWGISVINPDWRLGRHAATVLLLLGGFLGLIFLPFGHSFDKVAELSVISSVRQIRSEKLSSFFGAAMLWLLCFAMWDFYSVFLRDFFAIPPLRNVLRAAYRLLTTGSLVPNMNETLWLDAAVSVQEIGLGLLLGGVLAFVLVKLIEIAEPTLHLSGVLVFTHSIPIVLAITFMAWIGIGILLKAAIVAAAALFPFAEAFRGFRTGSLITRISLALENALPYAFVGMLFGELWASTAGLGFFLVVARATGYETEALAAGLIILVLMLSVSVVLRFVIKRLVNYDDIAEVENRN